MSDERRPNVVLINCDDLGYGDLGCYGSTRQPTPALDRVGGRGPALRLVLHGVAGVLAVAGAPCSPAATRPGSGSGRSTACPVLFPGQGVGLPADRDQPRRPCCPDAGYRTQMIGKWHCGDQPGFLPTNHGFDHYFGLPYSNDMGRQVPMAEPTPGEPARLPAAAARCCSTTR